MPITVRPSSGAAAVVTDVRTVRPSRRTTIGIVSPGLCAVTAVRSEAPPVAVLPSTETISSPLRSLPADGEPAGRSWTTTVVCTGMPSDRSAAVVAFSCESLISAALCCSASWAVSPLG
jgi:hypothetical protein